MKTLDLRQKLVEIARKDVGQKETTRNQGPVIQKYWPATNYPEGYKDRAPYCAAAMCYWLKEWLKIPQVLMALGKSSIEAEKWRCKSPAAFGWIDWAKEHGLMVMNDGMSNTLHTADIVVYDFSHVGLIVDDYKDRIVTYEANTGPPTGDQRDGDGIWKKDRPREIARSFIRLVD